MNLKRIYHKIKYYLKRKLRLVLMRYAKKFTVDISGRRVVLKYPSRSCILGKLYFNGLSYSPYELETRILLKELLKESEVFFDVGAHIGFYSYFAACVNPKILVYAFEPLPVNVSYMKDILAENKFSNISVEPIALWNKTGKVTFFVPVQENVYPSISSLINQYQNSGRKYTDKEFNETVVDALTLDEYVEVKKITRMDVVKIDVEEAEQQVLKGAASCLGKFHPDLIVEIMINTPNKQEIYEYIKSFGYESYLVTNAGLLKEDRPLTLPKPTSGDRTLWRNHYFTRRSQLEVKKISECAFGRYL